MKGNDKERKPAKEKGGKLPQSLMRALLPVWESLVKLGGPRRRVGEEGRYSGELTWVTAASRENTASAKKKIMMNHRFQRRIRSTRRRWCNNQPLVAFCCFRWIWRVTAGSC